MGVMLPLIIAAVIIWLAWYLANQFYEVAQEKGYSDKKYLWICFWLGLPGWLLIIALPDRKKITGSIISTTNDELPEL